MTSQGTAHGRFQRAIAGRNLLNAETAAREMGGLSLADALALCELLAATDPKRYERAALRWLQRFIATMPHRGERGRGKRHLSDWWEPLVRRACRCRDSGTGCAALVAHARHA